MHKLTILLFLFAFTLNAQTKKPNPKNKKPVTDSVAPAKVDTIDPLEIDIKTNRKFGVYTRKPRKPDNRMKLCINLVSPANMLNVCVNDSICRYPENTKILFEKTNGDSTYVLVYVDAFTKADDRPGCDAGHETKLFYFRWNTVTNKAIWKQRTVSSCIRVISLMNKEPIVNWDGNSILQVNYHKGGSNFGELKFDPQNYLLGFQSSNDNGQGN